VTDPQPWHFTTWLDLLDHWQTGIAGFLAFAAGFGTVVATMIIARRQIAIARTQIDAGREDADRVIAATSAQTDVARKQIETAVDMARKREASEAEAFRVMLEAAMTRVIGEVAWARKAYPYLNPRSEPTVEAYAVRKCITKGAFAELRGACVRQGSPLTGEFLDLEREIDSFASQWGINALSGAAPMPVRKGNHAGLSEQLASIEAKATELRKKAFDAFE
jgi:hypothetical protein